MVAQVENVLNNANVLNGSQVGLVNLNNSLNNLRALNNVLKHAGATEVQVRLTTEQGNLKVTVTDNGTGFDLSQAEARGGDGLLNIRKRLRNIGGSAVISSRNGDGTKVEMEAALR